jgi:hypothetical protein
MKRFTDTAIWQDEWFMNLSPDYKLAFMYIKDNCDCAGVYKPNKRLSEMMIGMSIDWEDFLNECGTRVKVIQGGYWWITRFIEFQYGTLSENCKPHLKVIETLKKYNLYKGYTKGMHTLEEKEKEKDKEEDKEEEKEEEAKPEIFYPFDTDLFRSKWAIWLDYRKEIKKPYKSKKSEQAALKQLSEYNESFAIHLIERSIAGGYQGLVFDNTKAEFLKYEQQSKQTNPAEFGNQIDEAIRQRYGG